MSGETGMRRLLLVLLMAAVSGCCGTPAGPDCTACRSYEPGYRRPGFPAYRPIDSAATR